MASSTTEFTSKIEDGQSGGVDLPHRSVTCPKAFITAPYTTDTSLLRQALKDRGMAPFELDEVSAEGRSIPEILEDCLKDVALVIAVAGATETDDRSMHQGVRSHPYVETQFCLGYAAALKKRILVLVPTDGSMLFGLPCVFFDPHQATQKTFDQWIDFVLRIPPRLSPRFNGDVVKPTAPLGSKADEFLAGIRGRAELTVGDLKEIARDVFEACGIDSEWSMAPGWITPGRQVDMMVFSDDFIPWIGTPLPVEFDVSSRTSGELEDHLGQFSRWIDQIPLPWGLLIDRGPDPLSKEQVFRHPNVFVISMERLIASLKTASPGEFLRLWRNRRVRGIE